MSATLIRVAALIAGCLLVAGCISGPTVTAPPASLARAPATPAATAAPPSAAPSASVAPIPSVAPGASVGPSVAPSGSATPATPSSAPSASSDDSAGPSEAPINNHAVPAREALLPDKFETTTLIKQSFDGTALGTDAASTQLEQFLAANGRQLSDFGEAGASDPTNPGNLTFVVFRVPGISGPVLQQAIVAATVAATPTVQLTTVTIGSRQVIKGTDPNNVRYIYAKGDLIYGVQTSTQEIADKAIALLP